MVKNVTKLYKGCVDIRDYEVKEAIKKNEQIKVRWNGEQMTLSPKDLKERVVSTSGLMKSKVGLSDYHLLSYEWISDE
jgi:hypothetical protein